MRYKIGPFALLATAFLLAACARGIETDYSVGSYPAHSGLSVANPDAVAMHSARFSVHGIDVSKYQGDIDWTAAHDGGVQFAWIKATEGADHMDEKFAENWQAAKQAGVRRGAYHFAFWCRTPAEQMRWFEQNVPVDPDALPPVLDVELTPGSKTCPRTLERVAVLSEMRAMLQAMERHYGKRPVIYSTVDFYAGILSGNALDEYPIWVRSTKYHPSVRYGSRGWHFWQYQADGHVPGIKGNVDRNAFYGNAQQWQAFLEGAR